MVIPSSSSYDPIWVDLLRQVHCHLYKLCKNITEHQRLSDGCTKLYMVTEKAADKKHVAVTKVFSESTLSVMSNELLQLNGKIHRAILQGVKCHDTKSLKPLPHELCTVLANPLPASKNIEELNMPMVALPWKFTAITMNWKAHLERLLYERFLEKSNRFMKALEDIHSIHRRASTFTVKESRIAHCIIYYHFLCDIEQRLSDSEHLNGVYFARELRTLDVATEKLTTLYNASVICTHLAAYYQLQEGDGLRKAFRLYEQAAGLLDETLRQNLAVDQNPLGPVINVGELRPVIIFLRELQLAQAQEILWRSSCEEMAHGATLTSMARLSKEAAYIALMYARVVSSVSSIHCTERIPPEWRAISEVKVLFYQGVAEELAHSDIRYVALFKMSLSLLNSDERSSRFLNAEALFMKASSLCHMNNKDAQLSGLLQIINQKVRELMTQKRKGSCNFQAIATISAVAPATKHRAQCGRKLLNGCRQMDLLQELGPLSFFNSSQQFHYRSTITVPKKEDGELGFVVSGGNPPCISWVEKNSPAEMGKLPPFSFLLRANGVDMRFCSDEDANSKLQQMSSPLRLTIVRTVMDPYLDEQQSCASTFRGSEDIDQHHVYQ
eukprot:gene10375-2507_t